LRHLYTKYPRPQRKERHSANRSGPAIEVPPFSDANDYPASSKHGCVLRGCLEDDGRQRDQGRYGNRVLPFISVTHTTHQGGGESDALADVSLGRVEGEGAIVQLEVVSVYQGRMFSPELIEPSCRGVQ